MRTDTKTLINIDPELDAHALADLLIAEMCKVGSEWEESQAYEIRGHMRKALERFNRETMPVTDTRPGFLREYDDGRYDRVAPSPPICPEHGPREVAAGLPDHPGTSGWGKVQCLDGSWLSCIRCGDCRAVLLIDNEDNLT